MIIDFRCPDCNRPVTGNQDVESTKVIPRTPDTCQHCGLRIQLKAATSKLYFFETHEDARTDRQNNR